AKCYGTWNGPGTVKVVIATADMEPASDDLVDAVTAHIEEQRLIGPTVTVVSATSVEINVTATIFTDGAYSVDAAKAAFMTELTAYLKTIGFSGGVVPYTRIGAIIQSLPGVNYYTGYTLNGGTANVEINDGELAVVGTETITGGVQS
ncbi:MAG: baseplate J/gp47 family protein, partial [Clostridiales bacterium]|nr:baseplate J/gp47 family protein [Clostridiales bacterium]